jgi:hypothetical protein
MATSVDPHWLTLCLHFVHHARQVDRFRTASELAVRCMWDNQINEDGEPLTPFERKALFERHCELFGVWPQQRIPAVTTALLGCAAKCNAYA